MSKALLLLCLFSSTVFGLSQTDQIIEVSADMAVLDKRTGISTYTGNALAKQGLLTLSAEYIELFTEEKEVVKVVAKGDKKSRAHYQQNQPDTPEFVKASAERITYHVKRNFTYLEGDALLVQGADFFSGDTLDYDIANDKVIIKKSKDGSKRVKFKIKL